VSHLGIDFGQRPPDGSFDRATHEICPDEVDGETEPVLHAVQDEDVDGEPEDGGEGNAEKDVPECWHYEG